MALPLYHPKPGDLLICDFDAGGFRPPEMVKKRPVVVVSCRESHGRRLCTVVPLSTTVPNPPATWHHPMPHLKVPSFVASGAIWAKCDMICTVGFERLNKPHRKTNHGRVYIDVKLDSQDLEAIRACLRAYLAL